MIFNKLLKKILCASVLICASVNADVSGLGLGLIVGEPTGLSAKVHVNQKNSVDAGLSWSFLDGGKLHVHADYLYDLSPVFDIGNMAFNFYSGVGARVRLGDNSRVGARIPLGFVGNFDTAPVDLFFELVPTIDFVSSSSVSLSGGIGARYYF